MSNPITWLIGKYELMVCRLTPSCHRMTQLLSEQMEHPLPWPTRLQMRWHFRVCVWCERYGEQLQFIREAGRLLITQAPVEDQLSEAARERIKKALRGAAQS